MKRLLLVALAILGLGVAGVAFSPETPGVLAAAKDEVCAGVGAATGATGCANAAGEPTIDSTINAVINILSVLVGIISVIMIIVGGFKYVTSGGDSGNVSSAKNTIIYALIGVVVVALSQTLVKFVLQKIL